MNFNFKKFDYEQKLSQRTKTCGTNCAPKDLQRQEAADGSASSFNKITVPTLSLWARHDVITNYDGRGMLKKFHAKLEILKLGLTRLWRSRNV